MVYREYILESLGAPDVVLFCHHVTSFCFTRMVSNELKLQMADTQVNTCGVSDCFTVMCSFSDCSGKYIFVSVATVKVTTENLLGSISDRSVINSAFWLIA